MKITEEKPVFDLNVEPTSAASKNFGDAEPAYFYGNRYELQIYLTNCFKEIRDSFKIKHDDGITRDWFYAMDNDVMEKWLEDRNFKWVRTINTIYKGDIENERKSK